MQMTNHEVYSFADEYSLPFAIMCKYLKVYFHVYFAIYKQYIICVTDFSQKK